MRQMFSKKQIEEMASQKAQEEIAKTPKGFDFDEIDWSEEDLVQVLTGEVPDNKLPSETVENATESDLINFNKALKYFIKRGYIFNQGYLLPLSLIKSYEGNLFGAIFGGLTTNYGYAYYCYVDSGNIEAEMLEV